MVEFGKIGGLFILSAIKFFLAPSSTILAGYSFLETILITSLGGITGFIFFFKFGNFVKRKVRAMFRQKSKPRFNKQNRFITKMKTKYGFYGIALLTPCLLSIPLGAFLASRFYSKDKRTIPVFIGSIVIWSIILSGFSTWIL